MPFSRSSGILLHPTSLPGPYGIGELGSSAYRWVDWLAATGSSLWQILPLGPTGYGDSPYQCFSAFAGNPYLISIEHLLMDGLLVEADLAGMPRFNARSIDFGAIYNWKLPLLDRAFEHYQAGKGAGLADQIAQFQVENAHWLKDFALFMALKEAHNGAAWNEWPAKLRNRDAAALEKARKAHAQAIEKQVFRQFLFFKHWHEVRAYANAKGIQIIGDIPIFVAYDSADAWANPELFYINESGNPTVVAGVPPDYFSATGQLWGNPLYRWDYHAKTGYAWWLSRLRAVLNQVDIIRLDHFRGFYDYWEVPAGEDTAINGRWVEGPRGHFFDAVKKEFGDLPILAEDLGNLNPGVLDLRDQYHLPGMKIMVFAFYDDPENEFLPHNHTQNCVVYTGTHDNDTVVGWYTRVTDEERDFARRYLARSGQDIAWDLIRAAWGSPAVFAMTTMQDLLGLGNEARMNYPGRASGNWAWRMRAEDLTEGLQARLAETNFLYARHLGWRKEKEALEKKKQAALEAESGKPGKKK
ncbi:MAG: 4-alpha-glucanotransferase [Anaerolineales bacterium]